MAAFATAWDVEQMTASEVPDEAAQSPRHPVAHSVEEPAAYGVSLTKSAPEEEPKRRNRHRGAATAQVSDGSRSMSLDF
ncbi:LOW QUALITY PROTEIN: hypothetical protein Ct61P_08793 [Colletotrichum tofieldiae]|nr:LOW QUALITY PROTEIN: hypothetical protein Ct61P_08793 [Colletotrichum tofieldiae]